MNIREEAPTDRLEIDALLREAFGRDDESELVSRLRQDGVIGAALVAEADGKIIGHLVLSRLPTQMDGRPVRTLALAPMAVRPQHQRRRVGSRLIEAAIADAKRIGTEAIIVLGHPAYYSRFGFSAELAAKLAAPFAGPAFMALELVPHALAGTRGAVAYPPAFGLQSRGSAKGTG
jgi:putative acetyltransferase